VRRLMRRRPARRSGARPARPRVPLAPMLPAAGGDAELARVDDKFVLSPWPDGWRCLALLDDRLRLRSRSGRGLAPPLPAIASELGGVARSARGPTVLDGILTLPPYGEVGKVQRASAFVVVDVLCAEGRDVLSASLRERQAELRAL